MAPVLLDTTILIDLLRGRSDARTRLGALRDAGDAPYACAVNDEETVRGLTPREHEAARVLFAGDDGLHLAALARRDGAPRAPAAGAVGAPAAR